MDSQLSQQQEHVWNLELHEDELRWAHEIKSSIQGSTMLENLTDFDYAQWAIVTKNRQDIDEVLERTYKMQCCREQYKLHKPGMSYVEEGMELFRGFMDLMPGFILSVDYMPTQGHYLLVIDKAAFHPSKIVSEKDWKYYTGHTYFLFQIMCSNFCSIRYGVAIIIECMGMTFQNYSPHVEERWTHEIINHFPFIHKESMWLNTPTVANVLISCIKPFLTEEQYNQIHLGCKLDGFEDERLDVLFHQPTPQEAQQNLLIRIEHFMREREQNVKTYKLPPLPSPTGNVD